MDRDDDFDAFDDEFVIPELGPVALANSTWPDAFALMSFILKQHGDAYIETWNIKDFLSKIERNLIEGVNRQALDVSPWNFALRFRHGPVRTLLFCPDNSVFVESHSGWRQDGPWVVLEGGREDFVRSRYAEIWNVEQLHDTQWEWDNLAAARRFERLTPLFEALNRRTSAVHVDGDHYFPLLVFVPEVDSDTSNPAGATSAFIGHGTWTLNRAALHEIWRDEHWPLPYELLTDSGRRPSIEDWRSPGAFLHGVFVPESPL